MLEENNEKYFFPVHARSLHCRHTAAKIPIRRLRDDGVCNYTQCPIHTDYVCFVFSSFFFFIKLLISDPSGNNVCPMLKPCKSKIFVRFFLAVDFLGDIVDVPEV